MNTEYEKEVIEDVLGDFGFRVRWEVNSHFTKVWAYEITARNENGFPLFDKVSAWALPDPVENIEDAEIYLRGYIKWDGCSELDQGQPHWCGVTGFIKHTKLLKYIHKRAFELMDHEPDGEWEE